MKAPQILTWESENAPAKRRWIALVVLPGGDLWGVIFYAETEAKATEAARDRFVKEAAKKLKESGG